jgi:hypothetical protein
VISSSFKILLLLLLAARPSPLMNPNQEKFWKYVMKKHPVSAGALFAIRNIRFSITKLPDYSTTKSF